MRKSLLLAVALSALGFSAAAADEYVHGYIRKDGTVVQPYYRTNPDSTRSNNYSTYPNVNPYTGQVGTHHVEPYSGYTQPRAQSPYGSAYGQPQVTTPSDPYGDDQH